MSIKREKEEKKIDVKLRGPNKFEDSLTTEPDSKIKIKSFLLLYYRNFLLPLSLSKDVNRGIFSQFYGRPLKVIYPPFNLTVVRRLLLS